MLYYSSSFPLNLQTTAGEFLTLIEPGISNEKQLSETSPETIKTTISGPGATNLESAFIDFIRNEVESIVTAFPEFSEDEIELRFSEVIDPVVKPCVEILIDRLFRRAVITKISDLNYGTGLNNADILAHFGDRIDDREFYDAWAAYFIRMAQVAIQDNSHEYRVIVRIVEGATPVAGAHVGLRDDDEFAGYTTEYGLTQTNNNGYCDFYIHSTVENPDLVVFVYAPSEDLGGTPTDLLSPPGNVIDLSVTDSKEFAVTLPSPGSTPSTPLIGANSILSIDAASFPASYESGTKTALDILSELNFTTLRHIRLNGGIVGETGTDSIAEAELRRVESYAMLELVSSDPFVSMQIMDTAPTSGSDGEITLTNIHAIGRMERTEFIRSVKATTGSDTISELTLGEVHASARGVDAVLGNVVMQSLAGSTHLGELKSVVQEEEPDCGCKDCEAAISPLAYLTDLLNYTLNHVKEGSQMVSLTKLMDKLHQEFPNIPASCDEVDERICQARMMVEVLMSYLSDRTFTGTMDYYSISNPSTELTNELVKYRKNAYEFLLNYLGTSYEEIRRIQSYPAGSAERKRLAERLGIPEVYNSNNTIAGLLRTNFTTAAATDAWLEQTLGLRRYDRYPLTQITDPGVITWKKAKLRELWAELDFRPDEYSGAARLPFIDPDTIGPDDLRNPVAFDKAMEIWRNRREYLDGLLQNSFAGTIDQVAFTGTNSFLVTGVDITTGLEEAKTVTINGNTNINGGSNQLFTLVSMKYANNRNLFHVAETIGTFDGGGTIRFNGHRDVLSIQLAPNEITLSGDYTAVMTNGTVLTYYDDSSPNGQSVTVSSSSYSGGITTVVYTGSPTIGGTNPYIEYPLGAAVNLGGEIIPDLVVSLDLMDDTNAFDQDYLNFTRLQDDATAGAISAVTVDGIALETNSLVTDNQPNVAIIQGSTVTGLTTYAVGETSGDTVITLTTPANITGPINTANPAYLRFQLTHVINEVWNASNTDWAVHLGTSSSGYVHKLNYGTQQERETTITSITDDYRLTVESFTRLHALKKQWDAAIQNPDNPPLTDEEAREFHSILLSSVKNALQTAWVGEEEEVHNQLELGPKYFVRSLTEPKAGNWPPIRTAQTPLLDPELISLSGLPDSVIGDTARTQYANALSDLETVRAALVNEIETNQDFEAMLNKAWENNPATTYVTNLPLGVADLDELKDNLGSGDPTTADTARDHVETVFSLSIEEFEKVYTARARYADTDPSNWPQASEWQEVYDILTSANKRLFLYYDSGSATTWYQEEVNQGLTYYAALKASLPEWLTSFSRRIFWQLALDKRSAAPIIDPDIISPLDIKDVLNFSTGTPTGTWSARRDWLIALKSTITNAWAAEANDTAAFNAVLTAYLGISTAQLLAIQTLENEGQPIQGRIAQLNLSYDACHRLLELQALLTTGLEDDEEDEVFNILVNAQKEREYATWKQEELDHGISLMQDQFRLRKPAPVEFPAEDPVVVFPWRYSEKRRKDWVNTLENRVEQENSMLAGWAEAIEKTEDIVLRHLRDVLILEIKRSGNANSSENFPALGTQDELAEWAHDRLLIDTKNDCCQKTNHVAMAIEALQGLLWGLRTDLLEVNDAASAFYNWKLSATNFEEEWKWIGSYATWRAAMFVFMYPENLTIPALRKDGSPAFNKFVRDTQGSSRLTPESACQMAKEYEDYFEDICTIHVKASCHDVVSDYGDCCDPNYQPKTGYQFMHMFFGQGGKTGRIYWSYMDPKNDDEQEAQSHWSVIPGLEDRTNLMLIGATNKRVDNDRIYTVIFFLEEIDKEFKIRFIKLNRASGKWGTIEEIDISPDDIRDHFKVDEFPVEFSVLKASSFTFSNAVIRVVQRLEDWHPVCLIVGLSNSLIFEVTMNDEVTATIKGSMRPWFIPPDDYTTVLHAAAHIRDNGASATLRDVRVVVYTFIRSDDHPYTHTRAYFNTGPAEYEDLPLHNVIAAIPWSDHTYWQSYFDLNGNNYYPDKFVVWQNRSSNVMQSNISINNGVPSVETFISPLSNLHSMATIAGPYPGGVQRWIPIYFKGSGNQGRDTGRRVQFVRGTDDILRIQGTRYALHPNGFGLFDIACQPKDTQLQQRKADIKYIYESNDLPEAAIVHLEVIKEAFFFLPMQIGIQLAQKGFYHEALNRFQSVYDWSQAEASLDDVNSNRKIYYGLVSEISLANGFSRAGDWLRDPLNPHAIAATRALSYNKFTLLIIIRTLLDYADSLYTQDTSETVPKARLLYDQALELLALLKPGESDCESQLNFLTLQVKEGFYANVIRDALATLDGVHDDEIMDALVNGGTVTYYDSASQQQNVLFNSLTTILIGSTDDPAVGFGVLTEVQKALNTNSSKNYTQTVAQRRSLNLDMLARTSIAVMVDDIPEVQDSLVTVSNQAAGAFRNTVQYITRFDDATMTTGSSTNFGWLQTGGSVNGSGAAYDTVLGPDSTQDVVYGTLSGARGAYMDSAAGSVLDSSFYVSRQWTPAPAYNFCIPHNPVIEAMVLRAELNLFKIRHCMNIAGLVRELEAFAAPTDTTSGLPVIGATGSILLPGTVYFRPTPYRYDVLIERAKQLVSIAQQIEAAFLSALEKRDQEFYNQLKARQDLETSKAQVKLQTLRVQEAQDGVVLSELQRERAQIQVDGLNEMINEGLLNAEVLMVTMYGIQSAMQIAADIANAAYQASLLSTNAASGVVSSGGTSAAAAAPGLGAIVVRTVFNSLAIAAGTTANIASVYASFERRKQEWEYQKSIAQQDVKIGQQQIKLAKDHLRVVGQERAIADIQVRHSETTLDFLANKFTNADLYEWMSQELERVYSYFLQEATSTALMAQNQLAFIRHETPPPFIQNDYWEAPASGSGGFGGEQETDRRGMTGSARLLQDIYRLDQYAFNTDKRKLQVSKRISLAQLSPMEFELFRQTGILRFATPMEMFDRDFPGHYLRLIREVKASVVALIPPVEGIKATLTNSGLSRVVIGGDIFQNVYVRRDPELIALSASQSANGLFELRTDDRFLKPFESLGVDTTWEFRLEKAANQFDYRTIADVILTIDYEALSSFDYRARVIRELGTGFSADLVFSFRNNLPDQWYDLNNPDLTDTPMEVSFETTRNMFAPNVDEPKIRQVLMYFSFRNGDIQPVNSIELHYEPKGMNAALGGEATPVEGLVSTRSGSAGSWLAITGQEVEGTWTLRLPNTEQFRNYLVNEELQDILFVITYEGEIPPYHL